MCNLGQRMAVGCFHFDVEQVVIAARRGFHCGPLAVIAAPGCHCGLDPQSMPQVVIAGADPQSMKSGGHGSRVAARDDICGLSPLVLIVVAVGAKEVGIVASGCHCWRPAAIGDPRLSLRAPGCHCGLDPQSVPEVVIAGADPQSMKSGGHGSRVEPGMTA